MAEYKLSYTGNEINEKLGKIDNTVCFTEQNLTEEQKEQARKNIGAVEAGTKVVEYQNFFYVSGNVNIQDFTYTPASSPNWMGTVCAGPFVAQGGVLSLNYDKEYVNGAPIEIRLYLFDKDGNPYKHTGQAESIENTGGFAGEMYAPKWWTVENNTSNQGGSFGHVSAPFTTEIPDGCSVLVELRMISPSSPFDSGRIFANWCVGGGIECTLAYYEKISAKDEEARVAIEEVRAEVEGVKAQLGAASIPDYWKTYLNDKLPSTRSKLISGITTDSFMFFTDHHTGGMTYKTNANNTKHIIDYVRKHTPVNMVVHGGDVLSTMAGQTREQTLNWLWTFHDDYLTDRKVLPVIGNHEVVNAYNTDGEKLTNAEVYSVLFKSAERWANTNGKFYYYLDNTSRKIRYIILDTESTSMANNTAQLEWFIDLLNDMDEGWTAVLFGHRFTEENNYENPSNPIITQIAGAYNTRNAGSSGDVSWDFTSASGTVACFICGHCHLDGSGINNGILIISVTTDCGANASQASNDINAGGTRKAGDISEQAVDLFIIDTTSRTIETIRLGYGVDRLWTY